ncbi:protein gp37 [Methylobacterium sp. RAS18]|nr:protein gp37 [Methylobacterium sp. RAS18]
MAQNSKIEWTEATWNPIVGCTIVSPGCTNCYAMKMAARLDAMGQPRYAGLTKPSRAGAVWTGEMKLAEEALTIPLRRKKPTTWFVNSMSDLFHESVPDAWIDRVFAVMALCPQHTFQVLTKRSARMRAYMAGCENPPYDLPLREPWLTQWHRRDGIAAAMGEIGRKYPDTLGRVRRLPLPNVWLGVSAEDQRRADERVPDLLATPAAVRFVSAEPLLGPIDFNAMPFAEGDRRHRWSALTGQALMHATGVDGHPDCTVRLDKPIFPRLDWIIVGGESGPNARPMHPSWARSIRDQCAAAGVAFHFKQHGAWADVGPHPRGEYVASDPRVEDQIHDRDPVFMAPVGKKAAGRLLDGVEHNGFPASHPAPSEIEGGRP